MTLVDGMNKAVRATPEWVAYAIGMLFSGWLFYLAATGGLGVEPIEALEHETGKIALQLLVFGLAVTPLRRHLRINLLKFRRAIGLLAFYFVTLHLLVWLVLDVQILAQIWADILKRPYITIGMAGFVLLVPLALTSNGWSMRRLGRGWHRLHQLVYLIALLGASHYLLLVKGFQMEPLLYMGAIILLLALRLRPAKVRQTA